MGLSPLGYGFQFRRNYLQDSGNRNRRNMQNRRRSLWARYSRARCKYLDSSSGDYHRPTCTKANHNTGMGKQFWGNNARACNICAGKISLLSMTRLVLLLWYVVGMLKALLKLISEIRRMSASLPTCDRSRWKNPWNERTSIWNKSKYIPGISQAVESEKKIRI